MLGVRRWIGWKLQAGKDRGVTRGHALAEFAVAFLPGFCAWCCPSNHKETI